MFFFFSSRRRHTRFDCDWSSDVCSSDLNQESMPAVADKKVDAVNRVDGRQYLWKPNDLCEAQHCQRRKPDECDGSRSEERRVGKECRSRWGAEELKER